MHDIVFINPPNHCKEDYLPLGLKNLYSIVQSHGYKTAFLDLQKDFIDGTLAYDSDSMLSAKRSVTTCKGKIYAFTVWNTSFPWFIKIAEHIKATDKDAIIVAGGPLVTLCAEELLIDYKCIDVCCRYEGEAVIEPLTMILLSGKMKELAEVANLSFRKSDGSIHFTRDAQLIENLNTLPRLDVDPGSWSNPVVNLEAGRGCSFRCYYCSSCFLWKYKPRYKSGKRIFQEMADIANQFKDNGKRPPVFHLEHDNFLMNETLLQEISHEMDIHGSRFQYGFAGRADLVKDTNVDLLQSTGCLYVYLGIETGSVRMQKVIRKHLSQAKTFQAIEKLQQRGIVVNANLMYGFPEEQLGDLYSTLNTLNIFRFLGVNVHISMLSPELQTPVGDAAQLEDYVYNKNSRYVLELTSSGFDCKEFKKIYVNHLYTLKNNYYDILQIDEFVRFWHRLATNYPLSVYYLLEPGTLPWKQLFSLFERTISTLDSGISEQGRIRHFVSSCRNISTGLDDREDIFAMERTIVLRKEGRMGDKPDSASMMNYYRMYNSVRKKTLKELKCLLDAQHEPAHSHA